MSEAPIRVLFVSTGGAARAVLAEGLLRRVGGERFNAMSAGTDPVAVDPLALRVLADAGISTTGLESRPLDAVLDGSYDYVITVCDDARSACPFFDGADQSIHWSYASPAKATGSDDERRAAYARVFIDLSERIRQFVVIAERHERATAVG